MAEQLADVVAKIKAAAERQGYTRNALAVAAGVPATTVTRLFSGDRPDPHLSTVVKLARVLGLVVDVKPKGKQ